MTRPRILIITRNLPPLIGGMERLNWHMADELSKYAEVKVIGPKGAAHIKPQQVDMLEAPLNPLPLFFLVTFCKAIWLALHWRPTVILAGSGLTAPLAWLASKLCNAQSAVYLHGLDITVKDRIYQHLWTPIFKRMDAVIVNSTPTQNLAIAAGVPKTKISIVCPGVSLPNAPRSTEDITAFKVQHRLMDKKILLSVGRLTTRKGLREFVKHSLPQIVQEEPNTILVVVGDTPKNSLSAGIQSVASIRSQACEVGVSEYIQFLGAISEEALTTVYEAADVHIFPVRHNQDDPEGFGMVAIEAAAHGLPTVAFASGGVIDAVCEEKSGYLIKQADYSALTHYVLQILSDSSDSWQQSTATFASGFAWPIFGEKIISTLSDEQTPKHLNHSRAAD